MALNGLSPLALNKYVTGHVTRVLSLSYSFEDIAIPDVKACYQHGGSGERISW